MPTYEYRCGECGHEFEEFQPITADALVKCPNCGKDGLKRGLGGGGGMIFKGQGFYHTDYKRGNEGKKAEAQKKDEKPAKESPGKDTKETPPARKDPKKE